MFERRPQSGQDYYGSGARESDMFERRPQSGQDDYESRYQNWEKEQTQDNRWDQYRIELDSAATSAIIG